MKKITFADALEARANTVKAGMAEIERQVSNLLIDINDEPVVCCYRGVIGVAYIYHDENGPSLKMQVDELSPTGSLDTRCSSLQAWNGTKDAERKLRFDISQRVLDPETDGPDYVGIVLNEDDQNEMKRYAAWQMFARDAIDDGLNTEDARAFADYALGVHRHDVIMTPNEWRESRR